MPLQRNGNIANRITLSRNDERSDQMSCCDEQRVGLIRFEI